MKFLRVNKNRKCPVCGQADWCGISEDGNVVACMRESTGATKQARNGAWIHYLSEDEPKKTPVKISRPPEITSPVFRRLAEEIDEVYQAFLSRLVLAHNHEADLKRRGVAAVARHLHGYKSMPALMFSMQICNQLSKQFDLRGVPGFYRRFDSWRFIDYQHASGYLIPIRNGNHQICALQLRRDDNRTPKYLIISSGWQTDGTSSGTPPHFAISSKISRVLDRPAAREVIITEGALKANIIADYSETPVVGLVSVTTFNESFPVQLKEAFPNLERAKIAFDMDSETNEAVAHQRKRLVNTLQDASIKATVLTWNREFKGLDDYLVSQNTVQKIAA